MSTIAQIASDIYEQYKAQVIDIIVNEFTSTLIVHLNNEYPKDKIIKKYSEMIHKLGWKLEVK